MATTMLLRGRDSRLGNFPGSAWYGRTRESPRRDPHPRPTPLGAITRGLVAGTIGTLAMDAFLYAEYKHGGGKSDFSRWEPWSTTSCTGDSGSRTAPRTASWPDQHPSRGPGTAVFGAGVWGTSYVVLPAAKLYRPVW
jgi:hypothetical protein